MEQDGSSSLHQEAEVVGVVTSERNGEVGGAVERVGEGDGAHGVGVEAGCDRGGVHGGRLHAPALGGEHLAAKLEGEVRGGRSTITHAYNPILCMYNMVAGCKYISYRKNM